MADKSDTPAKEDKADTPAKDTPKKDAPKSESKSRRKRDKEPTLPPDPHADQMEAAQGMSGSTNPRQGQPY